MIIEITVNNWEKHQNTDKRVKYCSWFKVSNRIFEDAKFYNLTNSEKIVFIFLLAECSKANHPVYKLETKYMQSVLRMRKGRLELFINEIEKQGFITCTHSARIEENRIEQRRVDTSPKPKTEPPKSTKPNVPYQEFMNCWNDIAGTKWPMIKSLSKKRKEKIRMRFNENSDMDYWKDIFTRLTKCEITWDWQPNFDWIVSNDNNHVAISEGKWQSVGPKIEKPKPTEYLKVPDEYR